MSHSSETPLTAFFSTNVKLLILLIRTEHYCGRKPILNTQWKIEEKRRKTIKMFYHLVINVVIIMCDLTKWVSFLSTSLWFYKRPLDNGVRDSFLHLRNRFFSLCHRTMKHFSFSLFSHYLKTFIKGILWAECDSIILPFLSTFTILLRKSTTHTVLTGRLIHFHFT